MNPLDHCIPVHSEYGTSDWVQPYILEFAAKLKRENPDYDEFRFAGDCPACRANSLISCISHNITAVYPHHGYGNESCGHFCANCGFSGSTHRPSAEVLGDL